MPVKEFMKPIVGDGKITIPARHRKELGLNRGDDVIVKVQPVSEVVADASNDIFEGDDETFELQAFGSGVENSTDNEVDGEVEAKAQKNNKQSAYGSGVQD